MSRRPARRPRAGATMLLAILALAPAGSGAAEPEPLHALRGTMPRALRRMTPVAAAPADLALPRVTVLLGPRRRSALRALIAAQQDPRSPHFGRWLDDEEIADRFAPSRDEYERVRRWFVDHGFTVVHDSPWRVMLVVAGTAGATAGAFGTSIALYRDRERGRTHRGPSADPVLPASIAGSVRAVLGLDDLPTFRPLVQVDGNINALAPADFAAAYQVQPLLDAGLTGAGQSVAVVARSNFSDRDVDLFASRFLGPPRVVPRRLFVGADPGILPDRAEQIEVLIDTQWAGALAPQAQVNVVIAPADGDIPEALAQAVYARAGDVISISFGLCEAAAPALATALFDAFYAFANAKGQTVVVASGDSGATECAPADRRRLGVNLLASSPHAVAVGGSSFSLAPDGTVGPFVEAVWNDDLGAGGGGNSEVFALPRYQLLAGLGVPGDRRALPDLTLAASPRTPGYVIVEGGQTRVVGGTSAGAPALASLLVLLNERLQQTGVAPGVGQLLPQLYRLGSEQTRGLRAPVFRDIVTGTNALPRADGFAAAPGFDRASGWGAPLGDALAGALTGPGRCEPALDCLVPAHGPRAARCRGEWLVEHTAPARRRGVPIARQRCRDGDPACDADGQGDGRCTVNVALCVNLFDARPALVGGDGLPRCLPGRIRHVRLRAPRGRDEVTTANRRALRAAIRALPTPTTLTGGCTATVPIVVPAGSRPTILRAKVAPGGATPRLVLSCEAA